MYTSNFATSGKDPRAVAISNSTKVFKVPVYKPLVPPWWMVKQLKEGSLSQTSFAMLYRGHLSALRPGNVLSELGDEAILLCWEGNGRFCHRHLAAEWLRAGGISVVELTKTVKPAETSGSLFG